MYAESDAILFVFDLTNASSFQNIENWLSEVTFHLNRTKNTNENNNNSSSKTTDYHLIGNKYDLIKDYDEYNNKSKQMYVDYCQNNSLYTDFTYNDLSATSSYQVNLLFNNVINKILVKRNFRKNKEQID